MSGPSWTEWRTSLQQLNFCLADEGWRSRTKKRIHPSTVGKEHRPYRSDTFEAIWRIGGVIASLENLSSNAAINARTRRVRFGCSGSPSIRQALCYNPRPEGEQWTSSRN